MNRERKVVCFAIAHESGTDPSHCGLRSEVGPRKININHLMHGMQGRRASKIKHSNCTVEMRRNSSREPHITVRTSSLFKPHTHTHGNCVFWPIMPS